MKGTYEVTDRTDRHVAPRMGAETTSSDQVCESVAGTATPDSAAARPPASVSRSLRPQYPAAKRGDALRG